jgi:CubicO group peptidase (beta-lactamase class C family)
LANIAFSSEANDSSPPSIRRPSGPAQEEYRSSSSLWIAPSRGVVVAMLTNRIHEVDDLAGIRAARPLAHDAVARWLGW